jgi:hypothetical protein
VNYNTVSRIKKFLTRSTQKSGLTKKEGKEEKEEKKPQSSHKLRGTEKNR